MDPHVPNNKFYMLNEIGRGPNSVHDFPRIIGRVSVKPGNPLLSVAILDNVFVCFLCVNRLRPIYRPGKPGSCNASEEMPRADDHQPCSPPQPDAPTRHSNESFTIMLEDLETAEGAARAEHEKVFGLNYQPTELLWCHEVRRHLRFPYVIYWDHVHCMTASGGVVGYIVNLMVLRFCAARRITICTKKPSFLYE